MAKAKSKAKAADPLTLRIVVDASTDTPAYYMNHAEIAVGAHDIAILFARLPSKPSRVELAEALESGELVVEPELQILVPPTLIPGFIEALEKTKATYEALHGEIRKPKE